MSRQTTRSLCIVAFAAALPLARLAAQADTLPVVPGAGPARTEGSATHRLPIMALAAVSAATFNQALGSPKGWSRTWGGYGRRLGDQVGFGVIEEGVRLSLGATVKWVPDTLPCRGRNRMDLGSMLPRIGCAVRETVVLRNVDGRARPNFPLGVGALAASAASTTWRPDASTPSKAASLVAIRVAVVFGATVVSHLVTDWRNDHR